MQLELKALEAYLSRMSGADVHIEAVCAFDKATTGATALKAFGYGRPLCVNYRMTKQWADADDADSLPHVEHRRIVLRQVTRNGFGRERDDDRFAEIWLDWATFKQLPHHVSAQDVVALTCNGQLESVRGTHDFLLITEYQPGQPYAEDVLRIRDSGVATENDLDRAALLAEYLAQIHAVKHDDSLLWRRRLRDLVGHGEGIMGLTDSYPPDYPLATAGDLQAIETAANAWRWRLKPLTHRLSQVHGDFHPFNILFNGNNTFVLLDRSRGAWGEPADDVSCLAINYLFFSLQRYGTLSGPLMDLYTTFWTHYLEHSQDTELLRVVQPWLAWRALVLASPQWYPTISDAVRHKLLVFARDVLTHREFDWCRINYYLED